MKKNYSPPKITVENANVIRARYVEGSSINELCKRFGLARNSVKLILKGETYNKYGEWSNLMEGSKANELF